MGKIFYLFLSMLALSASIKVPVEGEWTLSIDRAAGKLSAGSTYNVTIPSTLHLDLLKEQQIPDPFFGNNYPSLKWVSECDVSYEKNLTFDDTILHHEYIQLVFEGIDTYGQIFFNKQLLQETKNAFLEYRVRVPKNLIVKGLNTVKVSLKSTKTYEDSANQKNRMPFIYAHTRKPCYQYSWDWAPYLNTMGIWKPVYVEAYDEIKINYVWARNKMISEKAATLNFAIAMNIPNPNDFTNKNYKLVISYDDVEINSHILGVNNYVDVNISNPKLWWPNGIGEPYIYDFSVKLLKNNELIDSRDIPYGIKTVSLDQRNNSFTVQINGYPVYCKGANYVPPDMFYPRLINPTFSPGNTIENLISDAVQSNFNMIRLWGGGQYESDEFLELASRKGIMIFYDFMFSDSIYPSTSDFLSNVEDEVKQVIRKVRNYPCLTLWSGNNEILQGIQSWGWGRQNYKQDYHKLFEWLIPEVIKKQTPQIPYIPSSPVNGVGNSGFQRGGDIHFWGVWAGGSLFNAYKTAIGPFNSEFGTQALPVWETIKQFTNPEDRKYESEKFSVHERHNSRFSTLQKYHRSYCHEARNFEMEAYMSGLVQAYGIEIAIKYQRTAKPKSYGTLYWQMNDAWPAISWSSIDYYGRWKPLQFMAKRLYPDVAIFCIQNSIKAVNDNLYSVEGVAIIKIVTFSGTILFQKREEVNLDINQVKTVLQLDKSLLKDKNNIVIYTEIVAGRQKQMSSTTFLAEFKQLDLPKAKLYVRYDDEYNLLHLRTDTFIKNLFISNTEQYVRFTDNYFDLLVGEEVKVELVYSDHQVPELKKLKSSMVFRGYRQIHENEDLQVIVQG